MFGRNIGNEKRSANREPANVMASQEIVFGGASFFGEIQANAENNGEINPDNYQISCCENAVSDRYDCRRQHRTSLGRVNVTCEKLQPG